MERDKNYDLELAKYIWSILKSNLPVLMSWGVEIETVKVITCGLEFRVNGFKHTGKVQIVLNEGADLFEVCLYNTYKCNIMGSHLIKLNLKLIHIARSIMLI